MASFQKRMMMTRAFSAFTVLFLVVTVLAQTKQTVANVEVDDLALMFQNGFGSIANQMGVSQNPSGQLSPLDEAVKKMRDLYDGLQKNLMDARQRAANVRSSLTSITIERLKLV